MKKKVKRSWGWYRILLDGDGYWIKHLDVDGSLSYQSHKERDEYWLICVPKGTKHKLSGHGHVMELAIGNPKEEDIERYD